MTLTTPFDKVIEAIKRRGFHNHRLDEHSDVVSEGIFADLVEQCEPLRGDVATGIVKRWLNVRTPGARERKIDLLIGEPGPDVKPDLSKIRVGVENKSVITAHRNRDARFDDLNEALKVLHGAKSEAVLVATVLVGLASRVLNVPDGVKKRYKNRPRKFKESILPRLSSGDQTLWEEFDWAISNNREDDPRKTVEKFRSLPRRRPSHTHVAGYDYLLLVPIYIDNVSPPHLPRPNSLGIDVDAEYAAMLNQICKAYHARWHL